MIKKIILVLLASVSFVACATTQTSTADNEYMTPMQKKLWSSP